MALGRALLIAAAATSAAITLLASPVTAARPVEGGSYLGHGFRGSEALVALKASRDARVSPSSYARFFYPCGRRVRLARPGGRGLRVRRDGTFSLVRRFASASFRVRGRFLSRDKVRVRVLLRSRAGCRKELAVVTLHRKAAPPFSGCRSQRARTLLWSPGGRVFEQRQVTEDGFFTRFAYGCLFATGRRFRLDPNDHRVYLSHFRLAGPYTAYVFGDCAGGCLGAAEIKVVDLRTGKRSEPEPVSLEYSRLITDLELKDDGSVAWIEGATAHVWAHDALGNRLLDSGPGINSRSLVLRGSTLYWLKADVWLHATLH